MTAFIQSSWVYLVMQTAMEIAGSGNSATEWLMPTITAIFALISLGCMAAIALHLVSRGGK
jgi:hypothetical protein